MSIDALAMAGVDYKESGISFKEIEFRDMESTPQYLLAENESGDKMTENKFNVATKLVPEKLRLNAKIQYWKKAVASASS
ncbi:hypothetical protein BVRB_6g135000 [Beta vulgaris subsp. vulgaris]|nr:hypothetical protein BVRB_6g135000 [Beta vulgaris subsp. vulgaris]